MRILTLNFLILALLLINSGFSRSQDGGAVKCEAVMAELELQKVNIKPVGGSDDIMLEGVVSDPELSKSAEDLASLYFSKVFNIISVEKKYFSYQLSCLEYLPPQDNSTASKNIEILKESFQLKEPWHMLLFDNKQLEGLKKDLYELTDSREIDVSGSRISDNVFTSEFNLKDGIRYSIILNAVSMDNGFYRCNVRLERQGDAGSEKIYEKNIYCKNGEWIALTGFAKLKSYADSATSDSSQARDLFFIFRADELPEVI